MDQLGLRNFFFLVRKLKIEIGERPFTLYQGAVNSIQWNRKFMCIMKLAGSLFNCCEFDVRLRDRRFKLLYFTELLSMAHRPSSPLDLSAGLYVFGNYSIVLDECVYDCFIKEGTN